MREDFAGLLSIKPQIVLGNRKHYLWQDMALTTNHWRMTFVNADGVDQELTGGGIEVMRKDPRAMAAGAISSTTPRAQHPNRAGSAGPLALSTADRYVKGYRSRSTAASHLSASSQNSNIWFKWKSVRTLRTCVRILEPFAGEW